MSPERLADWQSMYHELRRAYFTGVITDQRLCILLERDCRFRRDALKAEMIEARKSRSHFIDQPRASA